MLNWYLTSFYCELILQLKGSPCSFKNNSNRDFGVFTIIKYRKYESNIETMKMINILFRRQSKSFALIAVKSVYSRVDSKNDYIAAKKEPLVNVPLDFTSYSLFSRPSKCSVTIFMLNNLGHKRTLGFKGK